MIMKWIARLFGAAPAAGLARPAAATPAAQAGSPPAQLGLQPADIDAMFFRWITGVGETDPYASTGLSATAEMVLDELDRLIESPASGARLVPRVPAVIPQLLRSLRDPGASSGDLARQLSQDVVLVAEVVREVNSPYYRPAAPVRNLEGAVMLLGENGLRMLLARVSFRPIISMQSGFYARMVAPHVWREAGKCALAASLLSTRLEVNPFEAYLAGLMQNVGLIVAFRLVDHICTDQQLPHSDQFCARLFEDARTLSSRIAALWDFPPAVVAAIEESGRPGATGLAQALAYGDQVAKLRMLVDGGRLERSVVEGMSPAALDVFEKIKNEDD
jgi:HD-like signal output (HDOD) protein